MYFLGVSFSSPSHVAVQKLPIPNLITDATLANTALNLNALALLHPADPLKRHGRVKIPILEWLKQSALYPYPLARVC